MLILKRRYEFWFAILALHKIGAACIPATHLLTAKDIIYRNNAADIKMIVCVGEDEVIKHVEESLEQSPTVMAKALIGRDKEGWYNFNKEIETNLHILKDQQAKMQQLMTISCFCTLLQEPPECQKWWPMTLLILWAIL